MSVVLVSGTLWKESGEHTTGYQDSGSKDGESVWGSSHFPFGILLWPFLCLMALRSELLKINFSKEKNLDFLQNGGVVTWLCRVQGWEEPKGLTAPSIDNQSPIPVLSPTSHSCSACYTLPIAFHHPNTCWCLLREKNRDKKWNDLPKVTWPVTAELVFNSGNPVPTFGKDFAILPLSACYLLSSPTSHSEKAKECESCYKLRFVHASNRY